MYVFAVRTKNGHHKGLEVAWTCRPKNDLSDRIMDGTEREVCPRGRAAPAIARPTTHRKLCGVA